MASRRRRGGERPESHGASLWKTAWRFSPHNDNELVGISSNEITTVTVTGSVEPGPANSKWYNTWAECRSSRARVSPLNGTFSMTNVPLTAAENAFVVTVTDVSGNSAQQTRNVFKRSVEDFEHDGNGNLTQWIGGSTTWQYEWDWSDRLLRCYSNDVLMVENFYGAYGRRIAKMEAVNGQQTKWMYVYDGWNIIAVLNGCGQLLESYTRGVGLAGDIGTLVAMTGSPISQTPGTRFLHHNHRGDVILVRSGSTTTTTYEYEAYGALKSVSGSDICRFTFSSKERDQATGFYYCGYRFHAPAWQRWPNIKANIHFPTDWVPLRDGVDPKRGPAWADASARRILAAHESAEH